MIIHAAPETQEIPCETVTGKFRKVWAYELQTAINRARPGDTVQLQPGRYTMPVTCPRSGQRNAPITIEGPKDGSAVLDGGQVPQNARNIGLKPLDGEFAFIKVVDARKLIFRNLTFVNNWPTCIYLRGAQDITIEYCAFRRGRFAVYARQGREHDTQRLLMDGCTWVQDPEHNLWHGHVKWEQVKHKDTANDASHFNGALFGSFDITGDVTIRNCDISHAFNAIRMDMRRDEHLEDTPNDGPRIARNRNVAIYNNTFSFIRDNAVEPEAGAENWYVFNNRFFNIHGTFSLDQVACRNMYYIGNTILNNRKPEQGLTERSGGVIFKFFRAEETDKNPPLQPRKHLWSVFNSVQTRTSYVKKGSTVFWHDVYNVLGMYDMNHPVSTATPRPAFQKFRWELGDVQVRGLVTNDPDYPEKYPKKNIQQDGMPKVDQPFDIGDFDPDPHAVLGGWDGILPKCKAVGDLRTRALCVTRSGGETFEFRADLTPGALDLSDHGFDVSKLVELPRR